MGIIGLYSREIKNVIQAFISIYLPRICKFHDDCHFCNGNIGKIIKKVSFGKSTIFHLFSSALRGEYNPYFIRNPRNTNFINLLSSRLWRTIYLKFVFKDQNPRINRWKMLFNLHNICHMDSVLKWKINWQFTAMNLMVIWQFYQGYSNQGAILLVFMLVLAAAKWYFEAEFNLSIIKFTSLIGLIR